MRVSLDTNGLSNAANEAIKKAQLLLNEENLEDEEEEVAAIYDKSLQLVETPGIYTAKATTAYSLDSNYKIQTALHSLGFYSGPTDGNLKSDSCKAAIRNFQKVYGARVTNGNWTAETKTKLEKAYSTKCNLINSTALKKIDQSISKYTLDYKQRDTFANVWAFLRIGMGLNQKRAAGVCGNILNESMFATDNAEDNKGYKKIHDTNYRFKTDDEVGYGLIQWTDKSRKEGLEKTAKEELKLNVSNINAQLAWFRKEVTGTGAYSKSWDKIKKAKTVKETSEIYLREIENPRQLNYDERTKHSRIIYNSIKNISGV